MTPNLRDWKDALVWRVVCDGSDIRDRHNADEGWDGRHPEWHRYFGEMRALVGTFESDYLRLRADELLAAREQEIAGVA